MLKQALFDGFKIVIKMVLAHDILRHSVAGDATKDRGVGHSVTTETVSSMHTAGIFTSSKETWQIGTGISFKHHTPHHVMCCRYHFHKIIC